MTSHLNSHRTTDIKPEMLSGVQTENGTPHDKYNIRGIAHVRTNRKDDIFMHRRLVQSFTYILEWGQVTCTLTKHARRWTYFALRLSFTDCPKKRVYDYKFHIHWLVLNYEFFDFRCWSLWATPTPSICLFSSFGVILYNSPKLPGTMVIYFTLSGYLPTRKGPSSRTAWPMSPPLLGTLSTTPPPGTSRAPSSRRSP